MRVDHERVWSSKAFMSSTIRALCRLGELARMERMIVARTVPKRKGSSLLLQKAKLA